MAAGGFSTAESRRTDLRSSTEPPSTYGSVADFLDELLDRAREALSADIAIVLLVDPTGRYLEATAAIGIKDEVLQGVRVPLGRGFAGRIAISRKPLIIENLVRGDVVNPLLIQRGVRSLLGVPLVADDMLLGVLSVGTLGHRDFTEADTGFLEASADRAAVALQTLLSRSEREAARELQRSLLPPGLPAIPGLDLASRYRPGRADVGGDWYDMFILPSGELCLAMGDVAGHGLGAATVMGRMRSALRAYALESPDPATVLRRLDHMVQQFEPATTATVLYAVCQPSLGWLQISSAGHWPPVLAAPGRAAQLLDISTDTLIGFDDTTPRHSTTVKIPTDALLCLYTDGLIERRDRTLDAGLERLCQSVFVGDADEVCTAVMTSMIGQEPTEDDVALLVLRRGPNARTDPTAQTGVEADLGT